MLGIIGGMGPLASQLLYQEIIEHTKASCDQEHIDMILLNHASMPDRTGAILSGDTEKVFSLLRKDAKFLETSGAELIAIPCNTSHFFWEDLQNEVSVPIVNMVREAVQFVKQKGKKKVGILATDGTIGSGIYKKECELAGIEYFAPEASVQKIVMKIIYEQIKSGLAGNPEDFELIDIHLKANGCDAGILACTELSCYRREQGKLPFYTDALEVLRNCIISRSGKEIK